MAEDFLQQPGAGPIHQNQIFSFGRTVLTWLITTVAGTLLFMLITVLLSGRSASNDAGDSFIIALTFSAGASIPAMLIYFFVRRALSRILHSTELIRWAMVPYAIFSVTSSQWLLFQSLMGGQAAANNLLPASAPYVASFIGCIFVF